MITSKTPLLTIARTLRPTSFFGFRTRFSSFCLIDLIVFLIPFINSSSNLYVEHLIYIYGEFPSPESLNGSQFEKSWKLRFWKTPFLNLLNLVFCLCFLCWSFSYICSLYRACLPLLQQLFFHYFVPLTTNSDLLYS